MLINFKKIYILLIIFCLFSTKCYSYKIITSIAPIYGLIKPLLKNTNIKIDLLLPTNQSPHSIFLKPSQFNKLKNADIIIWCGEELEYGLKNIIKKIKKNKIIIKLSSIKMLKFLNIRNFKIKDQHFFLNPENVTIILLFLTEILSKNLINIKFMIKDNSQEIQKKIFKINKKIRNKLLQLKKIPFIVLHDGFQYFEKYYNLNHQFSIYLHSKQSLSIKRLNIIRKIIEKKKIQHIFIEPQLSINYIKLLDIYHDINICIIDPIGINLILKNNFYLKLINNIAISFYTCFNIL